MVTASWDDSVYTWDSSSATWGAPFPQAPLNNTVEMYLNGGWLDVTGYVYGGDRSQITVNRGRQDEGTYVQQSIMTLTLNNRDGRWSPRNPTGPYYGQLGRNTPIRTKLFPASDGYANDPTRGDTISAPDSATLSPTGDLDIQVDYAPISFTAQGDLAGKWTTSGNQRSWALTVNGDQTLTFQWSNDGTTVISVNSTVGFSIPATGRLAVRATLDVDNGAVGNDVKFYTSDTIAGTWTQLGTTVTTAGVTSVFNSTASVTLGDVTDLTTQGFHGRLYYFKLYNGIAGTLVADANLAQEPDDSSFIDSLGTVWTLSGDQTFVNPQIRFRGEVTTWPTSWDPTGNDVWTTIEADGVLRRLTQGVLPVMSAMRRGMQYVSTAPVAYWPCEDDTQATNLASAIGGPQMVITGTPTLSSNTDFNCSQALPVLAGSEWTGQVPAYTSTGKVQVRFLMKVPAAGAESGQTLVRVYTIGSAHYWNLDYGTGGTLALKSYSIDGVNLSDSGDVAFNVDGAKLRVSIELQQSGSNVDWNIVTLEVGQSTGTSFSGTLSSYSIGRAEAVKVSPAGGIANVVIGHVSVFSTITSIFDLSDELNAHTLERASRRVERLCGEEGIPFRATGAPDDSQLMGPQFPATLIDLLHQCEDTDIGILYEPRDRFGLAYRIKTSLYNQDPTLELDYTNADLSDIQPVDDDQKTVNDVTVSRLNGSSARATLDTGPLSTQSPPNGVGRYTSSATVNVNSDVTLQNLAGWRLHLGTVDETRYPRLSLNLARGEFTSDTTKLYGAQDLDCGDRLTVIHTPAWLPPVDITQLAQGFVETLSNFAHTLDVYCVPETPWRPAVYGTSRYSSAGSTLHAGINSTATSISVLTSTGPVWAHTDGDFDILMAGEVMTVTAVTGTSTVQTFTVTRSVNGVVKSHVFGENITLNQPGYYAI